MTVATKKEWLAEGWKAVQEPSYKHDRAVYVPRIVAAILILAVGLALYAGNVFAVDPHMVGILDVGKGGSVAITDLPCPDPVAGLVASKVNAQFRDGWHEAAGVFRMTDTGKLKAFRACWKQPSLEMTNGQATVLVLFEDGDAMAFPREAFKKSLGTEI